MNKQNLCVLFVVITQIVTKKTQSAPFLQFGLNSKYDKTQIITKHKLWQTHIVTTQIVLKTQIVTKLSIKF